MSDDGNGARRAMRRVAAELAGMAERLAGRPGTFYDGFACGLRYAAAKVEEAAPAGEGGWWELSSAIEEWGAGYAGSDPAENDRGRAELVRMARALAGRRGDV